MHPDDNTYTIESGESAILLVEDDEADILLVRRAFGNAHIANPLLEVRDGQAAIQYLSGEGDYADRARYPIPFLILLDLRLPKLSGFEVIAWLRDQPHLSNVIVVVLTASDHVPDVTKARDLGANSYLVKPGNFEELVQMVKRIRGRWLLVDKLPENTVSNDSTRSS